MKACSFRLPDSLLKEIEREARTRRVAKAVVVRERLFRHSFSVGKNAKAAPVKTMREFLGDILAKSTKTKVPPGPPQFRSPRKQRLAILIRNKKKLCSSALALSLTTLACLLTACASIDITTTPFIGAPHVPPTNPDSVVILQSAPKQTDTYERLGEIRLDATSSPAPPITEIEARLRKEAAKLGADAVIVILDRIQPIAAYYSGGYPVQSLNTVTGHRFIGIAIKYKADAVRRPPRAV